MPSEFAEAGVTWKLEVLAMDHQGAVGYGQCEWITSFVLCVSCEALDSYL